MRYRLPLTVCLAALLPLPAVSQTASGGQVPRVGERIRVTATTLQDLDGRRVDSTRISVMVGTLVTVRPDGLVLADSTGRQLVVPTQHTSKLQVWGGTTVSPVRPVLGVLAGAALGGLLGVAAGTRDSTYTVQRCAEFPDVIFGCRRYRAETRTTGVTNGTVAAVGAAIGGVVGGVIGLISATNDKRERWTEIPIGALQVDVGSIWTGEVTARLPFRLP